MTKVHDSEGNVSTGLLTVCHKDSIVVEPSLRVQKVDQVTSLSGETGPNNHLTNEKKVKQAMLPVRIHYTGHTEDNASSHALGTPPACPRYKTSSSPWYWTGVWKLHF